MLDYLSECAVEMVDEMEERQKTIDELRRTEAMNRYDLLDANRIHSATIRTLEEEVEFWQTEASKSSDWDEGIVETLTELISAKESQLITVRTGLERAVSFSKLCN